MLKCFFTVSLPLKYKFLEFYKIILYNTKYIGEWKNVKNQVKNTYYVIYI